LPDLNLILAEKLVGMADDELILAHRDSEWCGHGPILEEDIAFANLALDELGHAMLWYRAYAELTGQDPESTPDRLVYFREAFEFRASHFSALPRGDWAFSMLRQYLWDVLEWLRLEALQVQLQTGRRSGGKLPPKSTICGIPKPGFQAGLNGRINRRMQAALD
jgi:ring-1,2-phenylacetyl-CoA epoxidase subunit PaaC